MIGACMLSNSWRFARLDLRPRDGRPPGRPKAPAVVPRPPAPPGRPGKPPGPPGPPPGPPGRPAPPPGPAGRPAKPPGPPAPPGPPGRPVKPPGRAPGPPGPPGRAPGPPGPAGRPGAPAGRIGRGGMVPGLGRGAPGTAGAGRPMPVPVPNGLLPGRGPAGRPMPVPVPNGLLPGRGPAGRGAGRRGVVREGGRRLRSSGASGALAGASGALGAAAGAARTGASGTATGASGAGVAGGGRVDRGRCRLCRRRGLLGRGLRGGRGCLALRGHGLLMRRTTGGSTVEDADFTNSPSSCALARTSLLVTRAPSRAHGPEPSTQLSCLGPGGVRRTVSASDTRSCSRAHGVFILELPIRSSGDGHRSAEAGAVAHAGPCCLGPMARGSSVRLSDRGPQRREVQGTGHAKGPG